MSIHFSSSVNVDMPVRYARLGNRPLPPEQLGLRIRERRESLDLKQEQLAEMVGISQGTLSPIERGRTKNPEAVTILGIAAALKTSPYILVYDHAPPSAMQHTVAALVDIWDRLDERQRLQVISYAQGLVDSRGTDGGDPPRSRPQQPKPPPRESH